MTRSRRTEIRRWSGFCWAARASSTSDRHAVAKPICTRKTSAAASRPAAATPAVANWSMLGICPKMASFIHTKYARKISVGGGWRTSNPQPGLEISEEEHGQYRTSYFVLTPFGASKSCGSSKPRWSSIIIASPRNGRGLNNYPSRRVRPSRLDSQALERVALPTIVALLPNAVDV